MTITAAATKYRYEGNGATTTFSYLNRVYAQSDLKVDLLTRSTSALVETLTLTTDYTVTIAANGQATVTITNATKIPSATQDILVRLDLPLTQATELPTGTAFPAKSVEDAVDKLTSIAQALAEVDTRTLKFSAQSPVTSAVIADPVDGATLVFDGTTGAIAAGPDAGDITDAAANAATATAKAAEAAASAATVGGFDLSGAQAANDAILWDTGSAKFVRKTIGQLLTALGIPYTAASASGAASLEFAEDTDNGTNKVTLKAPASLAANADVTLPVSGTLATLAGTETLTNKTLATPTINQGNLVGTTTNDNAAAGSVGEYKEASLAAGSATSLTTGTAKTVISVSLEAGDWDVWGNVYFTTGGTTSTTAISAATSIVNNTFPSDPDPSVYQYNGATVTNHFFRIPAGTKRYSLGSTTTVYLVASSNFTVSTTTAYGIICARRVR